MVAKSNSLEQLIQERLDGRLVHAFGATRIEVILQVLLHELKDESQAGVSVYDVDQVHDIGVFQLLQY